MKNRKRNTVCLAIIMLFTLLPGISADVIHGRMIEVSALGNGSANTRSLPLSLEDNWGIILESERDLLRGIEIQFELPEQADLYPGTYAVFFYGGVLPVPDRETNSYQGTLLFFKVIDGGRKLFVQLPLESAAGFGPMPDTHVHRSTLSSVNFPLIFAVMPIMKGIPDRAGRAVFSAQVRPIYKNLGKLVFSFSTDGKPSPDAGDVRIFIDDKPHAFSERGINIEPGIRRVRIEKDGHSPFLSTVGLDRGKAARVDVSFRKNESYIRLDAPSGTRAFLDGKSMDLDRKEITVEPGEHTLSLKLGDYQISKKFYVEPGKSYSLSLFLDILINQD